MINKEELLENNINFIDSEKILKEEKYDKIEKIKEILPDIINSDNVLNIEVLQDLLDITKTTANNQGYELKFAGKGFAKAKVDQPTTKELKAEIKQSKNFDTTENVIIRGDNIDALKILKQNYHGKIKMIYIDPPYNTGSDEFLYSDDFKTTEKELIEELGLEEDTINYLQNIYGTNKHSAWLSFMYPRLKLARELLTKDGVIFISIDDNEQANLKLLCDEVFGEENVDIMVWRKSGMSRDGKMKNTTTFRKDHEYIITCFKAEHKLKKSFIKPEFENEYGNPDNDPRGAYKAGSISKKEEASNTNSENYYKVISPTGKEFCRQFDISKSEFDILNNDNRIYWGVYGDSVPSKKIFINEKRNVTTSSTIIEKDKTEQNSFINYKDATTTKGTKELNKILLCNKIGEYIRPKPTYLIERLIQIGTNNEDIILDFFAGSGTTAHAVMDLNKEDGGNRKFILVQLDEIVKNEKGSIDAYNFIKDNKLIDKREGEEPYISDIAIERVNRSGESIKKELEEANNLIEEKQNIDIGYKVFSLVNKPKIEYENNQFELFNKREKVIDILYNMMSVNDVELSAKIEEIEKDKLYFIDDCYYIVAKCNQNLIDKKKRVYIDGYCNDIDLAFMLNLKETFKNDNIKVVY